MITCLLYYIILRSKAAVLEVQGIGVWVPVKEEEG
jgi:hypothetical protein